LSKKSIRQNPSRIRFDSSKEKAVIDNMQTPSAIRGMIEKVSLRIWYCANVPAKGRSSTGMHKKSINRCEKRISVIEHMINQKTIAYNSYICEKKKKNCYFYCKYDNMVEDRKFFIQTGFHMPETAKTLVNTVKIKKAIEAEVPLLITTYTLPHEMELYIHDVITSYMKELHQEHMTEYIIYCVNELTTNAKKANTKRVYFKEKKLDINSEFDYEVGMQTFKAETLGNIVHYLQLQKNAGLYIKILLHTRNGKIKIEIRNNSPLTLFEYKRIHDKLARAQQYTSVEEAFVQILDETEGAGLGLIIMVLMLQKIGLSDENFQFISENGETITRIILPLSTETEKHIESASKEIVESIEALPLFPENIASINRLLNDPDAKLSDIAQQISNDITLTADLLKLVNSAAFSLSSPCNSIVKAVQLVGIRGIKNLLFSLGSLKTLGEETSQKKDLWLHSYRVAFYSYNLARNFFASKPEVIDNSYVCGLLHDMGKVVFDNAHPDVLKKFSDICKKKDIPADTVERLVAGVNHAEIGARIGEKWNFPETIYESIRYHHSPFMASESVVNTACIVYLANMLAHYENEDIEFYQFDNELLQKFNLTTKEKLDTVSDRLKTAFEKEQDE